MNAVRSFVVDKYRPGDSVIIYGASAYGEIAYHVLIQNGIVPKAFCDRSAQKAIGNIRIIRPLDLESYKEASIIIATADAFQEVKNTLQDMGCKHLYDMCDILQQPVDKTAFSQRARDVYENRCNYIDMAGQTRDKGIYFSRIQFVVSECCSLRCRNCSHLMQYYKQPQNVNIDNSRDPFERFLRCVEQISELRIMGGEPFMNKDLYKLIEWYYEYPKIKHISIYTNGTIKLSDDNLKSFVGKDIRIHISDYGVNREKIAIVKQQLDEAGINYFIREYDSWQDAGGLDRRGYEIEVLKKNFQVCFERNSYTFFHGKLYRCARSAHGMKLGAIPWDNSDVVDFTNVDTETSVFMQKIQALQSKLYLRACDYCNGPNYHEGNIQAGIQVGEPLSFN